jgi:hypothetical protein
MPERRRNLRVRTQVFVSIEGLLFRTVDISDEGMMIEMESPPPVGKRLALTVAFGESMVTIQATVMRHEQRGKKWCGVGLKFDPLNSRAKVALQEHLIAKRIEEAAKP